MNSEKNFRFIDAQLRQMDKIGAKTDRVLAACAELLRKNPMPSIRQDKARIAAQKRADRKFDRQMKLLARQLSNRRQR